MNTKNTRRIAHKDCFSDESSNLFGHNEVKSGGRVWSNEGFSYFAFPFPDDRPPKDGRCVVCRKPALRHEAVSLSMLDFSADRIRWDLLTDEQIEATRIEAGSAGDAVLATRATRALARRRAQ